MIHVRCYEMKWRSGKEEVVVEWHPKSGSFKSMKDAVDACHDGRHEEHCHEVKQNGAAADRHGFW